MLTLQCVLYTYGGPGWCRNRVSVRWVDPTGTDLQKDHRYQVLTSPCSSNLTTKLESTGSNRRWTCEVTDGSQVKISYSYTDDPHGGPDGGKTTGIITRAVVSVAVFVALAVLVTYKTRPECVPAAEQHEADKETSEADRVCDSILEKRAEGSADAAADTLST
ncbi:hypothetical protein GN956_G25911 [Arapaima gigas]